MKILQVIHQDPRTSLGGSETYCRHLSKGLKHKNHQVGIFFSKQSKGLNDFTIESEKGIEYYGVDINALSTSKNRFQYTNSYANPKIPGIFKKALRAFNPDVVHIHHLLTLSVDIISLCTEGAIPVVATLHDYWYFCHRITLTLPDNSNCQGPGGGVKCKGCGKETYNQFPGKLLQPGQVLASVIRNKRLLAALKKCEIIYAPSHAIFSQYEKEGVSFDKLVHRPYGIPALSVHKKKLKAPVVFGYIGNLAPHKGIEVLIDAVKALKNQSLKVKIFGRGSLEYESYLRQKGDGLPIEFAGKFMGRDVETALNSIDVLIVPSIWAENSPLVIHEASSAKVPVVASNIGGIPEIVNPIRGGALFESGDSDQLSKILSTMCRKPDIIRKMKKNIQCIRSIEKEVDSMLCDYGKLVKRH